MADSKISALPDGGNLREGDQLAIARSGVSDRAVLLMDGWIDDAAETWTYASGSGGGQATFTVPGDLRTKYTVGTRIKLIQTTVKYFVVCADPTFAGGNTTVTISAGSDYTLANAAISTNFHSYATNPQGWPGWFNFTHSATGFTGALAATEARFDLTGSKLVIEMQIQGTSNATTLTFSLPFTVSAAAVTNCPTLLTAVRDNGTTQGPGRIFFGSTTSMTVNLTVGGGAFTGSGSKGVFGTWLFEI